MKKIELLVTLITPDDVDAQDEADELADVIGGYSEVHFSVKVHGETLDRPAPPPPFIPPRHIVTKPVLKGGAWTEEEC